MQRALKTFQDLCLSSTVNPSVLDSIVTLETDLNNATSSQAKQMTLTEYFHSHKIKYTRCVCI